MLTFLRVSARYQDYIGDLRGVEDENVREYQ